MGKSIISMVIFNSYFDITRGNILSFLKAYIPWSKGLDHLFPGANGQGELLRTDGSVRNLRAETGCLVCYESCI